MFEPNDPKPTHLVLYTDGGCQQHLGIGGWGVHGYFFVEEPAKVGTGCKKATPTAEGYKQGSTPKPDITITHYVDAFGSLSVDATNNIAELEAAIAALKITLDSGVGSVLLMMDSKYVLQGSFEWLPKWVANKWISSNGQPIANQPQWMQIEALLAQVKDKGIKLTSKWVKGHSGEFGNEQVDSLATLSTRAAMNGRPVTERIISPAKGYWKQERKYPRMLNLPTWYYGVREDATDPSAAGRTIYYLGDLREAVEFTGKMISNATLAVVYLKEPDQVLETIRRESHKLAKMSFYGLAVGTLPVIFKPDIYDLVDNHGTKFLAYDVSKNRLMDFKKEILVEELRPARRAYYAVDRLNMLEGILKTYLRDGLHEGFTFTDVTDLLYEVVPGKKSSSVKLKAHVTQAMKTLECQVDYVTPSKASGKAGIKLIVGQDIPDRNTLSALADEGIKVVAVTWAESDSVIRFATIVQTTDDVGIWSGTYSNLHILPVA